MSAGRRVAVVGAGLGGLATAIRLAADGADVTLLERAEQPGGRAGLLELGGFRMDTGPSVLTMPELLDELFALAGESLTDHVRLHRLDPAYEARFHDGSVLRVRASIGEMAEEVRAVCGSAEVPRFLALVERLRALFEAEYDGFIDGNFDSVLDLARPRQIARLVRLGGFRRVQHLVESHLCDWRLIRLFTFQSMYAGMSPYEALGVYAVIAYMDLVRGVYAVTGGIHAVSRALADLAIRLGVDVRYGTPVQAVDVHAGAATGVLTAQGRVPADAVVLNPDLPIAYRDLLPPEATPRRVRRLRYSPSCVVVHLGLDRPLDARAHHTISFAQDFRGSFDDILAGRMQREPSWFLSTPTVSDPSLAPPGGSIGFYLEPAPNLHGEVQDWEARRGQLLEAAQRRLEDAGLGPVRASTVVSEVVTPADWARRGMAAGTPFAASHHFRQTGPFRPRNVAPRVNKVVFVGSGTTPGVGVPMVLVSGKLAADRVRALLGVTDSAAAVPG